MKLLKKYQAKLIPLTHKTKIQLRKFLSKKKTNKSLKKEEAQYK
jgi:hypothetical protein